MDSQDPLPLNLHLLIGEPMKEILINPERSYRIVKMESDLTQDEGAY